MISIEESKKCLDEEAEIMMDYLADFIVETYLDKYAVNNNEE